MILHVLKQVAVLLEMALENIKVFIVKEGSDKDIFSVIRITFHEGITREVDDAWRTWFASDADFWDAIVAEARVDVYLLDGAGTASEARVPNEIELTIFGTLVIIASN